MFHLETRLEKSQSKSCKIYRTPEWFAGLQFGQIKRPYDVYVPVLKDSQLFDRGWKRMRNEVFIS